ncbi:MAG: serine/threonine-protein kinase, partial [Planctomycetota bacterium]
MTPEEYNRIQRLFLHARSLSSTERNTWLEELDDRRIAEQVESLLAHDGASDSLFAQNSSNPSTLGTEDRTPADHESTSTVPGQAGAFHLSDILGEGGFGTVVRGRQSQPVERDAAIKLIKPGMDSSAVLARFDAERKTLAMLQHPSIATFYDAGETDAGRPYFAMELVDGIPIDQFCEDEHLSLRERIALLEQTCEAVQHAHRKGVIHRDLKPSNVLAFRDEHGRPRVKVIDFGVSKALQTVRESVDTDMPPTLTMQGQVLGTLEYMSPEQAALDSSDLDIRTDVYSLGALTYKVLTGKPPVSRSDLLSAGYWKIHQSLLESRVTRPSKVRQSIAIDLDWVVLKAIAKDRDQRYATVLDLQRDLSRASRAEAVQARPPSLIYLTRVTIRRHRYVCIAASIVLVAMLTSAIASVWGWQTAERARETAVFERARAEQLSESLSETLYSNQIEAAWNAARQRNVTKTRQMLDRTPSQLRGFEWSLVEQQILDSGANHLSTPANVALMQIDTREGGLIGIADDGSVLARLDDRREMRKVCPSKSRATAIAVDALGQSIVGYYNGQLKRFDDEYLPEQTAAWATRGAVYDIAVSPSGTIAVCFGDQGVLLCEPDQLEVKVSWQAPTRMAELHFSPDSKQLVGTGFDGAVYVFSQQESSPRKLRLSGRPLMGSVLSWAWLDDTHAALLTQSAMTVLQLEPGKAAKIDDTIALDRDQAWTIVRAANRSRVLVASRRGKLRWIDFDKPSAKELSFQFDAAIRDLHLQRSSDQVWIALANGAVVAVDQAPEQIE